MNLRPIYVPCEMPAWWFCTSSILVGAALGAVLATLFIIVIGGF